MARLSSMMSRKSYCQEENVEKDHPAIAEHYVQQQHLLSCMICRFVPGTMCLLGLTPKQALDPILNLMYWKRQVSAIIMYLFI